MAALTEGQIIGITLAIITVALFSIWVLRVLSLRRKRFLKELEAGTSESGEDAAHNQILTTRAVLKRLESQGEDVTAAKAILKQAQGKLEAGRYAQALQLAREARNSMAPRATSAPVTSRVRVPASPRKVEKEELLYRDIAEGSRGGAKPAAGSPAGASMEETDIPESDGSGNPPSIPELRKGVPKNQLESRFEINVLEESLEKTGEGSFAEARKLLTLAQRSFDRGDYSDALRLAMRGRKIVGTGTEETISLSPATVVETPPDAPLPSAARSSAPPVVKDVVPEPGTGEARPVLMRCSRCGRENPVTNKFCRGCGKPLAEPLCPRCQKPVSPDDAFCGVCGAPISSTV